MAKRKSGGNAPRQPVAVTAPAARNDPVVATPETVDAGERKSRWIQRGVLGALCALVVGAYAYTAHSGLVVSSSLNAADSYYNLLVQGFRAGQLNVKREAPPGLAELADPYVLTSSVRDSGLLDLSYYKGRLYLYFGVTPALILFWPFAALTGHYLFHRQAVAIFCGLGFLASVGLLRALWRRYFAEVNLGVIVACVVALGLATGVPVLLSQSDVWEVPISCGYMLTMAGAGGDLVCVARTGAEVAVAGNGEPGLRAGGGGAALVVVWRDHPVGAGGPSTA